jgi:hypothetical protein
MGKLTLEGRRASRFDAAPDENYSTIPPTFFVEEDHRDVVLGLHGGVFNRVKPGEAYNDVRVKTADLAKFLAAKKIKTHVPSQREVNDIKAWAYRARWGGFARRSIGFAPRATSN